VVELEEFKEMQRQLWEEGDYPPVGRLIEPAAQILVQEAGVQSGQRVLDVGTGSGSVAVAAAQVGAEVVGVDITDAWFEEAHRRAGAAGVTLDLQLGDAEALPVEAGSFDVVLSSFAAIFAPRHDLVASEIVRVCTDGGVFGITAWTPTGSNNAVFSTLVESLPAPPEFVSPSILWGDPAHVRDLFASHDVVLRFDRPQFTVTFSSADAFETFAFENSGGLIAARRALEELGRWDEAHAAMREAIDQTNEADDGSYRTKWNFLLTIGTTAA
jgi:SAM-dependent methyltransferase